MVVLTLLCEPSHSLGSGLKLHLDQLLKLGGVLSICLIIAVDASDLGVYLFSCDSLHQFLKYVEVILMDDLSSNPSLPCWSFSWFCDSLFDLSDDRCL